MPRVRPTTSAFLLLSLTAAAAMTSCAGGPRVQPDDWTTFRGDNANSGTRHAGVPIDEPERVWEYATGGTVESSPTVVDGILYVGTFDNALHALDADTGEKLWAFPVGGLLRCSPAVVDGVVYFGADDDKFYAVDARSGAKLWHHRLGEGGQQSSPTVAAGRVVFGGFDQRRRRTGARTHPARRREAGGRRRGGALTSSARVRPAHEPLALRWRCSSVG